jgi:hypothetical protein
MRRSELAAAGATSRPRLVELPPRLIQIICPLVRCCRGPGPVAQPLEMEGTPAGIMRGAEPP